MKAKFDIYQYDGELYAIRRDGLGTVWGMCLSEGQPYIAYPYKVLEGTEKNYNYYDFRMWLMLHKSMTENRLIVDLFPVTHEGGEVIKIAEGKEIEYVTI